MKFVHAADLHLDSPLRGLERYEAAPVEQIRGATRRALKNLVELCIEESAKLLVIAGDLFDGDWRDYSTGLFFVEQMTRLREAGVRVVWIRGNHDAASKVSKQLRTPENVHELCSRRPSTVTFEEIGVAVHGQGFPARDVATDLALAYPDARSDVFNIGLLHTALDGRPGHDLYAPTSIEVLASKGYEYWALGHVHRREVLKTEPWLVFPGNLQGRHIGESGPKGATLVSIDAGRVSSVEHRSLDVVRWQTCAVDTGGATSADEVLERVRDGLEEAAEQAEGRLLATRVSLSGATSAHRTLERNLEQYVNEIRACASGVHAGEVWVEKVEISTRAPLDLSQLARRNDVIGQLCQTVEALRGNDDELGLLMDQLGELKAKLADLRRDGVRLDFETSTGRRRLLDEAEQILLPRLLDDEGRG